MTQPVHRTKVLILTTKWGHASIAQGITDALSNSPNLSVKVGNVVLDKFTENFYLFFYRLFHASFKLAYAASEKKPVAHIVKLYERKHYGQLIGNLISSFKPDVVINTYFAFNEIVENLNRKKTFVYLNVVADPWTFSSIVLSKTGQNLVFDSHAKAVCVHKAISPSKITETGWFVRKEFNLNYRIEDARKKLRFPINALTFSVIGGSAGTYTILKILPALAKAKKKLHVVFICGESKGVYAGITRFYKLHKLFKKTNTKWTILRFTKNIHDYIQASDIVIGKAGPNLLFETIACGKPFFAITHIAGQEDGNLEIIRQKKIGIVQENPLKAKKVIERLVSNPEEIKSFEDNVLSLAKYNRGAKDRLMTILNLSPKP